MASRLAGKVVIVTGAAKGIGKGIARMCAAEGAAVVINDRSGEEGRKAVEEIQRAAGAEVLFVQGDLSNEEACKQLIGEAEAKFGRIDGLVNNAGIFPRGTMLDTTEHLFDSVFNVNIKGAFFCTKYALASMFRTGGGSIVHIGSTNAYKGQMDLAAYSCSKGALLTLSRHVAANYGEKGIRSNWITVGWVASDGEIELHRSMGVTVDELMGLAQETIPSGRLQTAEDIAYGVIYLLSNESSQVTGTELAISGGHRI